MNQRLGRGSDDLTPHALRALRGRTGTMEKMWYICGTFLWYIHEICTKDNVLNRD